MFKSFAKKMLTLVMKKRRKIAVVLIASLLLTLLTCSKAMLRIDSDLPSQTRDDETDPLVLTAEQCESLGSMAIKSLVTPPPNPIAAERYREFQLVARTAWRRPGGKPEEKLPEDDAEPKEGVIALRPFVAYVAIAAVFQFLLGFVCAMHVGYQPALFGRRLSLSALDPFSSVAKSHGDRSSGEAETATTT